MGWQKRTRIVTAVHERISIRATAMTRAYCRECAGEERWLTLDEASCRAAMPTRELVRLAEMSALHSGETTSGQVLICETSLLEYSVAQEGSPGKKRG